MILLCSLLTCSFTQNVNYNAVVTGVKVTVRGKEVTYKARLLFTLADLPAKASLTNMIQFNGKFGCPTCEHEGKQVACGKVKYQPYAYGYYAGFHWKR